MNAGRSSPEPEVVPDARNSQNKYSVLLVCVMVVVGLGLIILVRPFVGRWMEVRLAYGDLSSGDADVRVDAIRHLRRMGKEPESKLIALLHHPNEGVRDFAAAELAHRSQVTDNSVEAFLIALEKNQHVSEIGNSAPKLFFRHADLNSGPLTKTDERMIGWLRTELNSTDPDRSGPAAWALTAFAKRDRALREPLTSYLKNGPWFYKYVVLRELADSDPALREEYVAVLLSGLRSAVHTDQLNAMYGLSHFQNDAGDLRSRLEARLQQSTDPAEIARIEQALEKLNQNNEARP